MHTASLYIHVPFCRHKCIYCDFYSVTQRQKTPYLTALAQEIKLWSNSQFQTIPFSTIYFGGGTPSLLSPKDIAGILKNLRRLFSIQKDAEISIEVNPGAILRRLSEFKKAGVNRLTIGVQSFHDDDLKFLTRIHSAQEAESAIRAARVSGFDNIGIDLIFGLPGQSLQRWQDNLRKAIDLHPEHISMYGLTYEEETPLWRLLHKGDIKKCDEGLERDMFLAGATMLPDAGYEHYEISNFALPGFRSRHNQKYWDYSPFLSFGPSAHSFDGTARWWNVSDLNIYVEMPAKNNRPVAGRETLTVTDRIHELILLGLRRREGVNVNEWAKHAGVPVEFLLRTITTGIDTSPSFHHSPNNYFLTLCDNRLCLTQQGLLFYNSVCEELFSVVNKAVMGSNE